MQIEIKIENDRCVQAPGDSELHWISKWLNPPTLKLKLQINLKGISLIFTSDFSIILAHFGSAGFQGICPLCPFPPIPLSMTWKKLGSVTPWLSSIASVQTSFFALRRKGGQRNENLPVFGNYAVFQTVCCASAASGGPHKSTKPFWNFLGLCIMSVYVLSKQQVLCCHCCFVCFFIFDFFKDTWI